MQAGVGEPLHACSKTWKTNETKMEVLAESGGAGPSHNRDTGAFSRIGYISPFNSLVLRRASIELRINLTQPSSVFQTTPKSRRQG